MNEAKFDALEQYGTNPLFADEERVALDYVTELTRDKKVNPDTLLACPAIIPSAKSARSSGLLPASIFTT
jgi:alkylhydroperoxidase family enzyme